MTKGRVVDEAVMMSKEAFSAAIELAKGKIRANPDVVKNLDGFIAYIENEISERFNLTVEMLKSVPKAISVAERSIELFKAEQTKRFAFAKSEIERRTPGLALPRSEDFQSGSVVYVDGTKISDGILRLARSLVCEERVREFEIFLSDKASFASYITTFFEGKFPGDSFMDRKCLAEPIIYQHRAIPARKEGEIKNIFWQMVRDRLAKKNEAAESNEWHANAVMFVSKLVVAELRGEKQFSKLAFGKKTSRMMFEGKKLPLNIINEGIRRGQNIHELNQPSTTEIVEKARLIKRG